MIYIYYHIYSVYNCFDIVKKQLDLLNKSIKENYELNIVVLSGTEQDKLSRDDHSKQIINWLNENGYNVKKFVNNNGNGNEWETLNCILEDKHKFNDDDFILYFHTKGVTHKLERPANADRDKLHRFNYEKFTTHWKKIMEYFLLEKCEDCLNVLKNTEYNTVGVFLNEPMWYCEVYAGNFFWIRGDYAKTINIDENEVDKKIRSTAEFNFINFGLNWKPYSMFNIPYEQFTTETFYNLYKNKKNEN